MKINLQEMRKIYQSHIKESTQMKRKNCPSPEILFACLRNKTSKRNKKRVIEHISNCRFCMEEFQFILEIHRDEMKLLQKISHLINGHSKKSRTERKKFFLASSILFWSNENIPNNPPHSILH